MELRRELLGALVCVVAAACGDSPQGRTYYERNIEPILLKACAGNTSGCHSINVDAATGVEDPFAFAAGNLDVTSFENIQKRRDVLTPFGAYPYPLLLIKAVGPNVLQFQYDNTFRPIEVQHSGGGILSVGSDAYFTLQAWLDNGATENGLRKPTPPVRGNGDCTPAIPIGFDPAAFRNMPGFDTFRSNVQPIFDRHGCTAGSCHGAPQSDFFLTCGQSDDQLAFNFSQAWSFVHDTGMPGAPIVGDSQLLRVPLAVGGGGRGHTGGDQFSSTTEDEDFLAIKAWAEGVGELDFAMGDPLKQFYADHVQPIFVKRGCAFQACHSPQGTNDFKLRAGSIGFFSRVSLERNYKLVREEFMALEFPDARRGRVVAKGILDDDDQRVPTGVMGIAHRGGPVLDTPSIGATNNGSDPANCPPPGFDPVVTPAIPYCIMQEWIRRERAALITAGQVTDFGTAGAKIVFVNRPANSTQRSRLDFDTFQGGATLESVDVAFDALGIITSALPIATNGVNLAAGCPGLGGGDDIQNPNVALDGDRVVFAARANATEPLGVFVTSITNGGCQRVTPAAPDSNGIKVHNFDPVFSPDGSHIVFASTRGKSGALRSRKRFLPQSDLWRIQINGLAAVAGSEEQMTFLSNSELGPGFMREGRVTMTTEKASQGFYQLSGRRINWDLTDYHPLLAQRASSVFSDSTMADLTTTRTSIGYSSATDIFEGANGDFLLILNDVDQTTGMPTLGGAGGALAIFNRSIGPFEQGRADVGYLQSVRILEGADGRTGGGYRRPRSLPDGQILASYTANVAGGAFQLVAIDPRNQTRTVLVTGGGAQVDAVLAYKHPPRELYENRRQLVFGGSVDGTNTGAILHMPDAPMVFTMLVANLRRGRPLDEFARARTLAVFAEGTCPAGACSANTGSIFESRELLGTVPLASDGSIKVALPSGTGIVFELRDGNGAAIVTMGEEHQLGPGESISMGVRRELFNGVCGGCHGSISARELDVAVTPDALTGASASVSQTAIPRALQ